MSNQTGSLIKLHYHENLALLHLLSDVNGNLYYKNLPIYTKLSEEKYNAIVHKTDGIYVDSRYFLNEDQYRILTKFDFYNGNLVYEDRIISWDYTQDQLYVTHQQIWQDLEQEFPSDIMADNCIITADDLILYTQDDLMFKGGDS